MVFDKLKEIIAEQLNIEGASIKPFGDLFTPRQLVALTTRTQEIDMAASIVSTFRMVREKMVDLQQRLAESKSMILDGIEDRKSVV